MIRCIFFNSVFTGDPRLYSSMHRNLYAPYFFRPLWSNWQKWPKLPKMAVMAWSDTGTKMVHLDFYAKTYINVDHLWKRNWKICIGLKVMAKTKSGVKYWPFPLYFGLFCGRKRPFQWQHFQCSVSKKILHDGFYSKKEWDKLWC